MGIAYSRAKVWLVVEDDRHRCWRHSKTMLTERTYIITIVTSSVIIEMLSPLDVFSVSPRLGRYRGTCHQQRETINGNCTSMMRRSHAFNHFHQLVAVHRALQSLCVGLCLSSL